MICTEFGLVIIIIVIIIVGCVESFMVTEMTLEVDRS